MATTRAMRRQTATMDPSRFVQQMQIGGMTGTVTPSRVTGGGTLWNPQFSFDQKLTPENYNAWATAFQQSKGNDPYNKNQLPGQTLTNWEMTANPMVALRMGMPMSVQNTAEEIAKRRGTAVDDAAIKRAQWRIGNQLYRQNVRAGFAAPGTYARQGGGRKAAGLWA